MVDVLEREVGFEEGEVPRLLTSWEIADILYPNGVPITSENSKVVDVSLLTSWELGDILYPNGVPNKSSTKGDEARRKYGRWMSLREAGKILNAAYSDSKI